MSSNAGNTTFAPNTPFNVTLMNGANIAGLIIANKSGYEFLVTPENCDVKTLYPGTADFFTTTRAWSGVVFFAPTGQTLPNVQNYPARQISFETVYKNEGFNPSTYPMSIAAIQAVSPTASGKPLFSATVGFGATVTAGQELNVFNPPTSGVLYTFHSARVYTNSAANPTANLIFNAGADINYGTPVSIISHAGQVNPPISTAHCTANDGAVGASLTNDIEVMNMQQNVTQDFLSFPDKVTLLPGGNMTTYLADAANGHVVRLTMKWSEDQ